MKPLHRAALLSNACLLATWVPTSWAQAPSPMAAEPGADTASTRLAANPTGVRASSGSSGLEEVIVTAQKREQSINEVPMSISTASGDQLTAMGIDDVRDLSKIVPGFTYTEATFAAPIYSLRGVGFNDSSLGSRPTVSVYVDEVPLPFSIMARAASLDVERVEVLKGPQGTLFGQNATGGAINYIAAKPTDTFSTGLDGSYGRFNAVDLGGYVSGPLSDTLSARLAVKHVQSDSWQQSYTRQDTLGATSLDEARLLLAWHPMDKLKVGVNLNTWHDGSDVQAAQLTGVVPLNPARSTFDDYPLAPHNARAADWNPGQDFDRDNSFYQASVRADYALSDAVTLTSVTSYAKYRQDHLQDTDALDIEELHSHTTGDLKSLSQELRLAGRAGDRANWIVGANLSKDSASQLDRVASQYQSSSYTISDTLAQFGIVVPPFFSFQQGMDQDSKDAAVFGNLDYDLSDTVTAHAGARYTESNIDFSGCARDGGDGALAQDITVLFNVLRSLQGLPPNAAVPPGACVTGDAQLRPGPVTNQLDEDNLSWRAGLDWKPARDLLLYANVSKGYKSGSFPVLAGTSDVQYAPVTQESVLAYEVGFKSSSLDRRMQLNGAVFNYEYSDKQIRGRIIANPDVFGPLEALVNVPKSRVRGAELQLTWLPLDDLTLNIGGTYLDTEVTSHFQNFDPLGTSIDFKGRAFPLTPEWQAVADAEYRHTVNASLRGFIGGSLTYHSATVGAFSDSAYVDIDAYTLLDLRAGVETLDGAWRFSLWGRNVTDEYYWNNATRFSDTALRYAGMPATYGLSVVYRY